MREKKGRGGGKEVGKGRGAGERAAKDTDPSGQGAGQGLLKRDSADWGGGQRGGVFRSQFCRPVLGGTGARECQLGDPPILLKETLLVHSLFFTREELLLLPRQATP